MPHIVFLIVRQLRKLFAACTFEWLFFGVAGAVGFNVVLSSGVPITLFALKYRLSSLKHEFVDSVV